MNKQLYQLTGLAAASLFAGHADALSFNVGDVSISSDNRLSIGGAVRMQQRDSEIIGIANGGTADSTNHDDGNLAFGRGTPVFMGSKLTSDLTVSYGKFGGYVRGSYIFDPVADKHDYFNAANYGAGKSAPVSEFNERMRAVQGHLGQNGRLLDAYIYGSFDLADHNVGFKLGRQVINWGESTLIVNGINSFVAADQNKLRVPGFELAEVFTPMPAAWFSAGLPAGFSMEAFYQLQWQQTYPDAVGSFFSTQDYAGYGATRANIGFGRAPENTPNTTVPRAPDVDPKNGGQFGVKVEHVLPIFNDMDLALYAVQYHSRLPLLSGVSRQTFGAPSELASYFEEFPENIRLYGASFNTTLPWDLALQGEYSFKQGQPLQIDDVELLLAGLGVPSQIDPVLGDTLGGKYIRGWRRYNVSQVNLGLTRIFGPQDWLGTDQVLMLLEAADMYVHNLPPSSVLRFDAPATDTPGDCTLEAAACTGGVTQNTAPYASRNSWGYRLLTRLTYNNVLPGLALEPTFLFSHDVAGTSPTPIADFIAGSMAARAGIGAHFLSDWSGEVAYTNFFGGGRRNLMNDRDYAEFNIKYSF
ncbi:MAG TPA: DUF1302 domain-containing protein [Nevskiaceae bacterium]|nr:DUF1302 domain-containing protein [Nevskiaceae bacterium]